VACIVPPHAKQVFDFYQYNPFVRMSNAMHRPLPRLTSCLLSMALCLLMLAGTQKASAQDAQEAQQPQQLPSITLQAGMYLIKAEVAQRQREHAIGLMWRKSMGINDGMLFIFPQATKQCFWMKNTLIPLSIAFIADDGRVVNVDEMQPQTEKSHCSIQPVRYVLEMNKGWFSKRGIHPGFQLTGAPFNVSR
jgi:uncharacterized protein